MISETISTDLPYDHGLKPHDEIVLASMVYYDPSKCDLLKGIKFKIPEAQKILEAVQGDAELGTADITRATSAAQIKEAPESISRRLKLSQPENPWARLMTSCEGVLDTEPEQRPIVIDGIIRTGDKLMLAAPSKAAKTFSLMRLALAVSSGGTWMGARCKPGKVLYCNFELHGDTFQHRLYKMGIALGGGYNADNITHLPLRGLIDCPASDTAKRILDLAVEHKFDLVIIDPVYKLGDGGDENSNGDVTKLLNTLEKITTSGACLAFAHHFSKGQQGGKKAIDRASGAGAWGRDADAIVTLSEVEGKDDLYMAEFVLRAFPFRDPEGCRWEYPIHTMVELEHDDKVAGASGRPAKHTIEDVVRVLSRIEPAQSQKWRTACYEDGISRTRFFALKKAAIEYGKVNQSGEQFHTVPKGDS